MSKHVVILCGLETIYNPDGSFKLFSSTFGNNAATYVADHPDETVDIIDARDYRDCVKPMSAVMGKLRSIAKLSAIDMLVYNGHSSCNNLLMFYKWSSTSSNDERFITENTSWKDIEFSGHSKIELWSCRTGGNYIEDKTCIAQHIANNSKVPTWGYICRTSQKKIGNKYYQKPEKAEYYLIEFKPMG